MLDRRVERADVPLKKIIKKQQEINTKNFLIRVTHEIKFFLESLTRHRC